MVSHQQLLSPTWAFKILFNPPPAYLPFHMVFCLSPSQLYTRRAPKQLDSFSQVSFPRSPLSGSSLSPSPILPVVLSA